MRGDSTNGRPTLRETLTTHRGDEVGLRPAGAGDEPFLHALYADRREPELAVLGWTEERRREFVDQQFRAQQVGYADAFPDAAHWMVTVSDAAVGRLLVDRRTDEHLVVDVVVLSDHRGLGIGTALMDAVLTGAHALGLPVRLSAAAHDQRLVDWYRRLGFVVVADRFPNVVMECHPDRQRRVE